MTKKNAGPKKEHVTPETTALIAPSDYREIFNADKQPKQAQPEPAATALIAPSDYQEFFNTDKQPANTRAAEARPAVQTREANDATALIAPPDYEDMFNVDKQSDDSRRQVKQRPAKKAVKAASTQSGGVPYILPQFQSSSSGSSGGSSRGNPTREALAKKNFAASTSFDDVQSSRESRRLNARTKERGERQRRVRDRSPEVRRRQRSEPPRYRDRSEPRSVKDDDDDVVVKSRPALRGNDSMTRSRAVERAAGRMQDSRADSPGETLLRDVAQRVSETVAKASREVVINKKNARAYLGKHGIDF